MEVYMENWKPPKNQNLHMDPVKRKNSHYRKPQRKRIFWTVKVSNVFKGRRNYLAPLYGMHGHQRVLEETNKSFGSWSKLLQNVHGFLHRMEKKLPLPTKNNATIKRFWECLPVVHCWKIWLSRNKSIFKDQAPKLGKILSKTWGLTSEFLNMKGTIEIENNPLQREERDWISRATIRNNGNKNLRDTPIAQNWKIRLNEEEFTNWKGNQKWFFLFFDMASKNNLGKAGVGGIINDPLGKMLIS